MPAERNTINQFDRVAPLYDFLASLVFGRSLQQAQLIFLSSIPKGASVLLAGGGTGALLEQLIRTCEPQRVLYLDLSAKMVDKASQRMIRNGLLGTVEFRVGNILELQAAEPFDVIMTPFLLDLFTPTTLQKQLIPSLINNLKTNGLWLITDFIRPNVWWQKALLEIMIRFFRITANIETHQLADWQLLLAETQLIRTRQARAVKGMVSAEVWTYPNKASTGND
ncbi:class I SAM-dependent methyltransferase [Spirosoma sp. SC4-14]|uniref:class I SAM-dependent methyltransferase n=1 Tax=Spirosoma sp. SC4-14 TaxID=3128900 RepID=UPI0030D47BFF